MKPIHYLRLSFASISFATCAWAGNVAIENPQVASGQVAFEGLQSDHATITQFSNKAIVDYQRFDVMAGGSVNFNQPSAQAAILNRIAGADPSMLNGAITGNGQIYFVNPAGITFGPNSVIRADTFMAVAGQIRNEDFLAGRLNFDLQGEVRNYGLIETLNDNALLGNKVFNAGDIVSRSGVSILTAGDEVLLRANGSTLAVQLSDRSTGTDAGVAVENTGTVSGDEVLFSAGDAYSVALSQSGRVKAQRSAKLYADGGKIEVSGEVSAHSDAGAGLIEVGGTYRGGDSAPIAAEVLITETAVLDASALSEGDGGEVIVYADKLTTMLGGIYAEGKGSGQGGFVEISAKELELGDGLWDIRLGQGGSLLFDPVDVTIDGVMAGNIVSQLDSGADVAVNTVGANTGAGDITVAASVIAAQTSTATLTLDADNDILVNQNIDVGAGSLFLNASNDVIVNASLVAGDAASNSRIGITADGGSLTLQANGLIELFGNASAKIVAQALINNSTVGAISATPGVNFWQIALPQLGANEGDINTFGGLSSGNRAVYGSTGSGTITANEYHFAQVPTIGIQVDADSKTYGESPTNANFQQYTVDPATFVNATLYGSVFTQDTIANTIDDTGVVYTSLGAPTDANVGAYAIDATNFVSANGYDFGVNPGTLTVDPRAITVTANDRTKIYGNSLNLGTTDFELLDAFDGDAILPNGETIDFAQLNSANGHATDTTIGVSAAYVDEVTVGTVGGASFDANNYTITRVAGDLAVTPRAITVAAAEQGKTYGNVAALDNSALIVTDLDGDNLLPNAEQIDTGTLSFVGTNLASSPIAPAVTTTGAIEVTAVAGSGGFDVANYSFSFLNGDYVVTPRPIVVSAGPQSKQYGTSLTLAKNVFTVFDTPTSTATLPNSEGITSVALSSVGGYDADTVTGVGTFANDLTIASVDGSINGFNAANYSITFLPGEFSIIPRSITLTADSQSRQYGDLLTLDNTAFEILDLDSDAVLPNGDAINTVSLASAGGVATSTDANVGTYVDNLTPSAPVGNASFDLNNYDIDFVAGNVVIARRPLELIASQQQKFYGNTLTLDNTGFTVVDTPTGTAALPNGEQVNIVTLASTGGIDASTTAAVGTYAGDLVISDQSGSAGFDAGNYTISYTAGDLLLNARPITITASEQGKIYGDTLTLNDTAFSVTDLSGGALLPNGELVDTVAVTSTGGLDASTSAAVGSYANDLTPTAQTGSNGFVASNYDITYATGDFVITPRALTLTASQQSRTYGDTLTLDDTAFTVLDKDGTALLPNGETVDTVAVASTGNIAGTTTADAATYSDNLMLSGQAGSNGFVASNYDISYVAGDLVINPRQLELIASQQQKFYGNGLTLDNTAFTLVDTPTGTAALPNGEQVDIVTLASTGGIDASTTAAVGTYAGDLVISDQSGSAGFDAGNYTISYTAGDLLLNARPITITASEQGKIYGDTLTLSNTAFSVTDLSGGALLPNGELVDTVAVASTGSLDASTSAAVGSYANDLTPTAQTGSNGFVASNYDITYANGDFVITSRGLTLTASQQSRTYGDPLALDDTAFTVLDKDGTAFLPNGETVDTVAVASTGNIAGTTTADAATYSDNLMLSGQAGSNGFVASNYDISYVAGDLVINPRQLELIASQQQKFYGNGLTLDNTAFTLVDTPTGTAALPNGEQVDIVTLASTGGIDASTTAAVGTYANDLEISGQSGSAGFDAANYTITHTAGDLLVNARPITITASGQDKIYGDTLTLSDTAFSVTDLNGGALLPNGELVDAVAVDSTAGLDDSNSAAVGSYAGDLTPTAQNGSNGFVASNYNITYANGDFVITPRALTLTASQQSRTYGDTLALDDTAFTVLDKDGTALLPNGETVDTVAVASTGNIAGTTTADAATYSDNLVLSSQTGSNGFVASNYDISYVAGDLVVNPRQLELIASQQQKFYGSNLTLDNTAFTLIDTPTGTAALPNGEQVDLVTLASTGGIDASTTASVGTYAGDLAISGESGSNGFDAANYTISYTAGDLLVNARPITIRATEQDKIYGDTLTLSDTAFSVTDLNGGALLPNGELVDTVTVASTGGLDASTSSGVGTYTDDLTPTAQTGSAGFDAANYDITYADGDFVITPRALTLTASQQSRTYGDTLVLDDTAFSVLDKDGTAFLPNGETVDTVAVASTGNIAGTTTADAATYSDNLVLSGQTGSNGFVASNYDISYVAGDLVINPRQLELIASQQEKFYGNTLTLDNTAFTLIDTPTGTAALPNGEQVDFVTLASAGGIDASTTAAVGTYTGDLVISDQSGSAGFDSGNYTVSYTAGDLLVNARPITISATDQTQIYGQNVTLDDTAFTLTDLNGGALLPNGEQVDTVAVASAGGASSTSNVGLYVGDLSLSGQVGSAGFDAANYAITYQPADYTVTPRAITLTGVDQSKPFGTSLTPDNTAFTLLDILTGTGLLPNGEAIQTVLIESLDLLAQSEATMPGLYSDNLVFNDQVGGAGFNPANYAITYVPAALEVVYSPEPPITPADAQPNFWEDIYAGSPVQNVFMQTPVISTNPLTKLIESPIWKRMSRMQQAWVLAQIEALDDQEAISEELLDYLIAESSAR